MIITYFPLAGVRRRTAEYLQIAENFAAKYTQQKLSKKPTVVALAEIRKYKVVSGVYTRMYPI